MLVHGRTQVCPTPHTHPKLDSLSLFPASMSGNDICLIAWESSAPPAPPSACTLNCYVLFTSTLPFPQASSPSSSWSQVLNKEHFSSPEDVWQCPETSLVATVCGGLHWHLACRGPAAGKHPTVHRAALTTAASHPAQSVNNAEVEKTFRGPSHHHLLPGQAQGPLNQPSCRHLAPTDPSLPRSQSHLNTSILLLYFRADPSSSPGPSRPGVIWPRLCSHPAFSLLLHLCAHVSLASFFLPQDLRRGCSQCRKHQPSTPNSLPG